MVYGIDLGTTNSLIGNGDKLFSGLVVLLMLCMRRDARQS